MKDSIKVWLSEQFDNDNALITEVYSVYCSDMKKSIEELTKFFNAGDVEIIWRKAHAMKGLALAVGDSQVADLCLKIEKAGKAGDVSYCSHIVASLQDAISKLEEA